MWRRKSRGFCGSMPKTYKVSCTQIWYKMLGGLQLTMELANKLAIWTTINSDDIILCPKYDIILSLFG